MVPPPPTLKIPATRVPRRQSPEEVRASQAVDCFSDSSDEFVSLGSSTTDVCSSVFTNPYGIRKTTGASSQSSSDHLSQFGTARDYHDFDMQNDLCWYEEKDEEHYSMPSIFGTSEGDETYGAQSNF